MSISLKYITVGDIAVGKTSIITRYTQDSFSENHINTLGLMFDSIVIKYKGEDLRIQIWDTAGQEQFHGLTTMYYKSSAVVMVVFDVNE